MAREQEQDNYDARGQYNQKDSNQNHFQEKDQG